MNKQLLTQGRDYTRINEHCLELTGKPITYLLDLMLLCSYYDLGTVSHDEQGLEKFNRHTDLLNQFNTDVGFGLVVNSLEELISVYEQFVFDNAFISGFTNPLDSLRRTINNVISLFNPDSTNTLYQGCARRNYGYTIANFFERPIPDGSVQLLLESKGINVIEDDFDFKSFFNSTYFLEEFNFNKKDNGYLYTERWEAINKWLIVYVDKRTPDKERVFTFLVDSYPAQDIILTA